MSKGCVIFAIDNEQFQYTKLADIAAGLVRKNLDIPTTIITNRKPDIKYAENYILVDAEKYTARKIFDKVDYVDIKWFNHTRADVYDLTPYDKTILLDADFLVFEQSLKQLFYLDEEFLCYRDVFDPTNRDNFTQSRLVSDYTIQNAWATVCYFKKSDKAEAIFTMMKLVRDNYDYYHKLLSVPDTPFRNDYALALSLHTLSGYGMNVKTIPGRMTMLDLDVQLEDFNTKRGLVYSYMKQGKKYVSYLKNTNVHILGKWDLQRNVILDNIEACL
jgi:hypothetical protein